jgi:hypothetical protein
MITKIDIVMSCKCHDYPKEEKSIQEKELNMDMFSHTLHNSDSKLNDIFDYDTTPNFRTNYSISTFNRKEIITSKKIEISESNILSQNPITNDDPEIDEKIQNLYIP